LRYCPALSKKPVEKRNKFEKPTKKPGLDPFEDPRDLLVTKIPVQQPTHAIVLNKYPVIPQHFILATTAYKEQSNLLELDDLATTYACLTSWDEGGVFAFFNSGPHSGASQGHRHVFTSQSP